MGDQPEHLIDQSGFCFVHQGYDCDEPLTVDALAAEIRRVDGAHSLGAAELAEALMPFLTLGSTDGDK